MVTVTRPAIQPLLLGWLIACCGATAFVQVSVVPPLTP